MNNEKSEVAIFSPDTKPYGLAYEEWVAFWWRRMFSIPIEDNPAVDTSGKNCGKSQMGPVWFLAGTVLTSKVVRVCDLPPGKALLIPIINSERCTAEFEGLSDSHLLELVANDVDEVTQLSLEIDGAEMQDFSKYRVRSHPFDTRIVDNNILDHKPGVARMVSDGFWVLLKPMPVGVHTIRFKGTDPNLKLDVTYNLNVRTLPNIEEIIGATMEELRACIRKISEKVAIKVEKNSEYIIQDLLKAAIPSLNAEQVFRDKTCCVKILSDSIEQLLLMAARRARNEKFPQLSSSDVAKELLELEVTSWPF
ncbi:MAG: hypothetical protein ACRD8Z_25755 [Nitrososphaeraceae archaeon]